MAPVLALWFALLAAQHTSLAPPTAPATPAPTTPAAPAAKPAAPPPPPATDAETPCAPGPTGVYEGLVGLTPPKILHSEDPVISDEARKNNLSGSIVSVTVDAKGLPTRVHIVHSAATRVDKPLQPAALKADQSAIDAVKKYRFEAATCNGKAVPYELNIDPTVGLF